MDERGRSGEVTHLLFADDTLIFCDVSRDQVLHLLATLVCFQDINGLKINLEKTVMYTVGDVPKPDFFADIFGCRWCKDPPKYLGYPLGAKLNSNSLWTPSIDKYRKRLEG
ncbi:unnamed protein product [Linum trigynum]